MLETSFYLILINVLLLLGLITYYFGLVFLSNKITIIGVYVLLFGLSIFGIHSLSSLIPFLRYIRRTKTIDRKGSTKKEEKQARRKQNQAETKFEDLNRYIMLNAILALLAIISLIIFYGSWHRLIEGYRGLQLFNFFNF